MVAQLNRHSATLTRLSEFIDNNPFDLTNYSTTVNELRMRHEQFSRELNHIEVKLAEQMAQTEYAQENIQILAKKCTVELPQRKQVGR